MLVSVYAKLAPVVNLFTSDGEKLLLGKVEHSVNTRQPFLQFMRLARDGRNFSQRVFSQQGALLGTSVG